LTLNCAALPKADLAELAPGLEAVEPGVNGGEGKNLVDMRLEAL
jgi:hypothetical protein